MKLTFSLASTAIALTLFGCRAPLQVDLAPDGKVAALATSSHLAINPVGDSPAQIIYRGESSEPKWSPDGNQIAFYGNGLIRIYDFSTRSTRALPAGLAPPFEWSVDGSELLALNREMEQQQVYHLGSKEVVRKVDLPFVPTKIAVAKEGRGFAVAAGETISEWKQGRLNTIQAKGTVVDLAYSSEGLRWLVGAPGELETEQKVTMEWDDETGARAGLELDLSALLDAEGRKVWPATMQFSPQGDTVGILVLVNNSPPGVLDKLMLIEHQDSEEAEQLNAQLRFKLAFAAVELSTGKKVHLQQFAGDAELQLWWQIAWSQDGKSAAIVSGENLRVVPGLK